jgi:hypothetical protein
MFNTYLQKLGERLDAVEKRIAHLDSNRVPGALHQYLIKRNQSQMSFKDNQRHHIPIIINSVPTSFSSAGDLGSAVGVGFSGLRAG